MMEHLSCLNRQGSIEAAWQAASSPGHLPSPDPIVLPQGPLATDPLKAGVAKFAIPQRRYWDLANSREGQTLTCSSCLGRPMACHWATVSGGSAFGRPGAGLLRKVQKRVSKAVPSLGYHHLWLAIPSYCLCLCQTAHYLCNRSQRSGILSACPFSRGPFRFTPAAAYVCRSLLQQRCSCREDRCSSLGQTRLNVKSNNSNGLHMSTLFLRFLNFPRYCHREESPQVSPLALRTCHNTDHSWS